MSDLFNDAYEVLLLMLARFFAHTGETEDELKLLIDVAITEMFDVIEPLGELLTALPAGPSHPGLNAGPSFQFYRSVHVLPHKTAAWVILAERMSELAEACGRIADEHGAPNGLGVIHQGFVSLAGRLGAGSAS